MGNALAVVNLLNAAAPGLAELVLLIRHKDGTLSVLQVLDEAEAGLEANLKQVTEALAKLKNSV